MFPIEIYHGAIALYCHEFHLLIKTVAFHFALQESGKHKAKSWYNYKIIYTSLIAIRPPDRLLRQPNTPVPAIGHQYPYEMANRFYLKHFFY